MKRVRGLKSARLPVLLAAFCLMLGLWVHRATMVTPSPGINHEKLRAHFVVAGGGAQENAEALFRLYSNGGLSGEAR